MSLVHLRVPPSAVGHVLGKQGANIIRTQVRHSVKCEFLNGNDRRHACELQRGKHCLHITGPLANVKSAVAATNGLLRDYHIPECSDATYVQLKGAEAELTKQ